MSKLTKLINNPTLFFKDSINKRLVEPISQAYNSIDPSNQMNINKLSVEVSEVNKKNKPMNMPKKKVLTTSVPDKTDKNVKHYRSQLLNFKQVFPVNNIRVNDENLWPVFRFAIWRGLRNAWHKNKKSTLIPLKTYISRDWYEIYHRDFNCLSVDEIEECDTDFLFFTNFRGVEQLEIDGKVFNRITDPVFEEASKVGNAKKIEIVKGTGGVNINRFFETMLVIPPLYRTVGYAAQLELPANFHNVFKKFIPDLDLNTKDINDLVEWYYRDKELYESILKKVKPKVVFFIGFEFHLALSAAAHDLGIKAVDLQHGLQTGWGPLYKWWEEMPPAGYKTLPTYFGVWGKRDKEHLSMQIPSTNHKTIELGYKWIDKQFTLVSSSDRLKPLIEKSENYKLTVLVTLQHQDSFPEDLYQVISTNITDQAKIFGTEGDEECLHENNKLITANDILWLIRKHPKGKNAAQNIFKKYDNVLCGTQVDDVYIGEILKNVDYHITSSSTVVIEADYFGVESIIFENGDIAGYENYQNEIENGLIKRFFTPVEFYQYINQTKIKYQKNSMSSITSVDIKPLLKSLL